MDEADGGENATASGRISYNAGDRLASCGASTALDPIRDILGNAGGKRDLSEAAAELAKIKAHIEIIA
jgi:hypothetical protein